jgi:hypothetical protein
VFHVRSFVVGLVWFLAVTLGFYFLDGGGWDLGGFTFSLLCFVLLCSLTIWARTLLRNLLLQL